MYKRITALLKHCIYVIMIGLYSTCTAQTKVIPSNSSAISYEGRIIQSNDAALLSWPGTSASISFEGTEIGAILKDLDTANYYNVIVDNKYVSSFHTDTVKHSYKLVSNLLNGKHSVQLFKRTEWDKGKTLFYGFETTINTNILPKATAKKRKIEFFGNSITCGYGTEDTSGHDSGIGYYENNYLSYANLTAMHYNAEYYCTSKSGIGIMVSWFPLIMPEMYDRLDATDSTSKWDFKKFTPDIVVIDLFQNDSWIVEKPDFYQFKYRFGTQKPTEDFIIQAYKNFVTTIRGKYPNAQIICTLGSMDATKQGSPWPGYVQKAVELMNDKKIYTYFFAYKNTPGHPKVNEQKAMSDSLIKFIDKHIQW